ncbi:MAG: NUDIX domain-containing protein [Chloroflexi bacterium]|nr:MAG: NUDIX domain-containing protein [Chloroflexota bacterium]TME04655.1 MAG: NUDIX domain-containing protein [Chloroflexota bacterium]TME37953.1 MAG: NUDIX domain-containing protein [Chloroflexota bacterium]TME52815.1 MAG: NUDIX domain-containing protein [Chloroflexota bacterium]
MAHFCVNCGAPLVLQTIEGHALEVCPKDGYVLWRDPKVAAAVVVEADGGIVLGRRAIEPGYGLWCLPGGFVDDDEDPAAAAVRECREEINAQVVLTGLLGVYHIAKTTASSIIGIAYRGRLVDGESISAGPEMLEVAVFSPDELPQVAFPSHQAVLSAYVRSPAQQGGAELLNAGAAAQPASQPSPVREAPRRQHKR